MCLFSIELKPYMQADINLKQQVNQWAVEMLACRFCYSRKETNLPLYIKVASVFFTTSKMYLLYMQTYYLAHPKADS